jgi:hypothetical protein
MAGCYSRSSGCTGTNVGIWAGRAGGVVTVLGAYRVIAEAGEKSPVIPRRRIAAVGL